MFQFQQCDLAVKNLSRIFTTLRIGLNAREEDLLQEIHSVRESASAFLQRRRATSTCLRKLTELVGSMEDAQIEELKKQLQVW